MPRKKQTEPPEAQSERFREAVRELEAAGELNPIDADAALDKIVRDTRPRPDREERTDP